MTNGCKCIHLHARVNRRCLCDATRRFPVGRWLIHPAPSAAGSGRGQQCESQRDLSDCLATSTGAGAVASCSRSSSPNGACPRSPQCRQWAWSGRRRTGWCSATGCRPRPSVAPSPQGSAVLTMSATGMAACCMWLQADRARTSTENSSSRWTIKFTTPDAARLDMRAGIKGRWAKQLECHPQIGVRWGSCDPVNADNSLRGGCIHLDEQLFCEIGMIRTDTFRCLGPLCL